MGDLRTRIEIAKLAHQIGVAEEELDFLVASPPAVVRDLRDAASEAIFRRNEKRVRVLASASRTFPAPLVAKIAQHAFGPLLSARVAAAMDPKDAAKLATSLDGGFLAELAASLDPHRTAPILRLLPDDLLLSVGRKILVAGDLLTLGRLFSVVPTGVAVSICEGARASDVMQTALYADDPSALDAVVKALSDGVVRQLVVAATEDGLYDAAVSLLLVVSAESATRMVAQGGAVSVDALDGLVAAIDEHDVWPAVVAGITSLDADVLARLVNVPATLRTRLFERFVGAAHELGRADAVADVLLCLDREHLSALKTSEVLGNRDLQGWIIDASGAGDRLVPLLESLGMR